MIIKYEISAGKRESIRFDASHPAGYEPTNERRFSFTFDDNTKISLDTVLGGEVQNFDLTEFGGKQGEDIKSKIDQIKDKLVELGYKPVIRFAFDDITDSKSFVVSLK
jgi:hypothetical protein